MCVLAKTILTQTVFLVLSVSAFAASDETQFLATGGGPIEVGPLDSVDHEIDELHPSIVAKARAMAPSSTGISPSVSRLARASNQKLDFPLRLREHVQAPRVHSITNFVDLNSSNGLKDFNCGKRTYDGHNGIDYILGIYAWRSMDDNEVEIVAAAPGVIVDKQDGHFDRQCSWGPFPANYVIIQQDDGLFAYYWHMKKGSVIKRPVGDRVRKSEYLGLVGSSGSSTTPHLHFELRDANGATIDPYAGKCGAKKTIWKHQPEAVDTEIISVRTHSARPQPPRSFCHKPEPSYSDTFAPGDRIWIVAYLRDQTSSAPARIELVRPDGLVHASWRSRTPPKRRVNTLAWYWGGHFHSSKRSRRAMDGPSDCSGPVE